MRCDKCGVGGAQPAILTVCEDDGELLDEARWLLCPRCSAELLTAVEVKEQ